MCIHIIRIISTDILLIPDGCDRDRPFEGLEQRQIALRVRQEAVETASRLSPDVETRCFAYSKALLYCRRPSESSDPAAEARDGSDAS